MQRNSNFPTITGADGKEHVLNHDKANCFAQYFASKCSLGQNDLTENNTPATRQRTQKSIGSVHFRPGTVRRELRRLNSSKATGPDNIPARVLKECADALCKPFSRLFSLCYTKGRQPALENRLCGPHPQEEVESTAEQLPAHLPAEHYI